MDDLHERLMRSIRPRLDVLAQNIIASHAARDSGGSPIEVLMGGALALVNIFFGTGLHCNFSQVRRPLDECIDEFQRSGMEAGMFREVHVDNYRVDFMILHRDAVRGIGKIAVECDGHEFHERTKKQATHDKTRDRVLQNLHCKVLRFTGSEVWADPVKCAEDIIGTVWSDIGGADNTRWKIEEQAKAGGELS